MCSSGSGCHCACHHMCHSHRAFAEDNDDVPQLNNPMTCTQCEEDRNFYELWPGSPKPPDYCPHAPSSWPPPSPSPWRQPTTHHTTITKERAQLNYPQADLSHVVVIEDGSLKTRYFARDTMVAIESGTPTLHGGLIPDTYWHQRWFTDGIRVLDFHSKPGRHTEISSYMCNLRNVKVIRDLDALGCGTDFPRCETYVLAGNIRRSKEYETPITAKLKGKIKRLVIHMSYQPGGPSVRTQPCELITKRNDCNYLTRHLPYGKEIVLLYTWRPPMPRCFEGQRRLKAPAIALAHWLFEQTEPTKFKVVGTTGEHPSFINIGRADLSSFKQWVQEELRSLLIHNLPHSIVETGMRNFMRNVEFLTINEYVDRVGWTQTRLEVVKSTENW